MKSFRQHIEEKREDVPYIPYNGNGSAKTLKGLYNPRSADELRGFIAKSKHGFIRFLTLLASNEVYVWDGNDADHDQVLKAVYADKYANPQRLSNWDWGTAEMSDADGIWIEVGNPGKSVTPLLKIAPGFKKLLDADDTTILST